MHIIMESKKFENYLHASNTAKTFLPDIEIEFIITDFETGLKKAIKSAFPTIKHKACYFHYSMLIKKKFKELFPKPSEKDIHIKKIFQNLPFLTNEEMDNFWKLFEKKYEKYQKFVKYFISQFEINNSSSFWIQEVRQKDNRTQSSLESYHKQMKSLFVDGKGPNVPLFTQTIFKKDMNELADMQYMREKCIVFQSKPKITFEARREICLNLIESIPVE